MNIKETLNALGYDNSENLFFYNQLDNSNISAHNKRILKIINPKAAYIVNDEPLVVFFDDLKERIVADIFSDLWNSQIPIIISDEGNTVKVYSSMNIDITGTQIKLNEVEVLDKDDLNKDSDFSYWNVMDEDFLTSYDKVFSQKSINDYLIENLKYLKELLVDKYELEYGNKLILRLLLIRYLIDRKVNIDFQGFSEDVSESQDSFIDLFENQNNLYLLFDHLKMKFNGNLFEVDSYEKSNPMSTEILNEIQNFFKAEIQLESGQLSLFPHYDFNIIPVELISNVYEIILGYEVQTKDKAFYTPEHLVDYILNDTVKDRLLTNNECKVIDPSCGSGIFLVKALRLILEKNANSDGYIEDNETINNIVSNNIFGIDINSEAIDITIFSLYITLLDFINPKDLSKFKFPDLKTNNILNLDFFDDRISNLFFLEKFDFIIGNPPWGKVNQDLYLKYNNIFEISIPDKEISVSFLIRIIQLADGSSCSLVLPSKILYKKGQASVDIRRLLLTKIKFQKVVELSSLRKLVFSGATSPAVILNFQVCSSLKKDDVLNNEFQYISIMPNNLFKYYNLIIIQPEDVKYVKQELLMEYDWAWKTLVYGRYGDYDLIKNLFKKYKNISTVINEEELSLKNGVQTNQGDKKNSEFLIGKKILKTRGAIDHLYLNRNNYEIFDLKSVHRPRTAQQFEAPYVLISKGLKNDYSIRSVYSEESFIYRDSISGLKGDSNKTDILKNFAGLLNSSLYSYLTLMLGSSAGVEREQMFLDELKTYPYVFDDEIVSEVEKITSSFYNGNYTEKFQQNSLKTLNEAVLSKFNLLDNEYIDYILNYQIPRLNGKSNSALDRNGSSEREKYRRKFMDHWNKVFNNDIKISTDFFITDDKKFTILNVIIDLETKNTRVMNDDLSHYDLIKAIEKSRINDSFIQMKNVLLFEKNQIKLIKRNKIYNWHRSHAVEDCNDIINTIIFKGDKNVIR